jgi:hypothetical protein
MPTSMSAVQLRLLIVRTRQRYAEIDHADWDTAPFRYRTHEQHKWVQAAREIASADWVEYPPCRGTAAAWRLIA